MLKVAYGRLFSLALHSLGWLDDLCLSEKGAIVGGIIATAIAFLAVPYITKSSLGELGYWFDYVTLIGVAAMYGAVAAALIWPLSSPKVR